jgi:hypothetical protein
MMGLALDVLMTACVSFPAMLKGPRRHLLLERWRLLDWFEMMATIARTADNLMACLAGFVLLRDDEGLGSWARAFTPMLDNGTAAGRLLREELIEEVRWVSGGSAC